MKYFKNSNNELFVNPIVENHKGLMEISKADFNAQIVINSTPTQAEKNAIRVSEIYKRLDEIDIISARPIRSKLLGKNTPFDDKKLNTLDSEANALRIECSSLQL